ncbi:hypothetical protein [Zhongshania marina]|uniref:Uncharacterized protein n=1 Tax=Zhongshania marina TaxID=2304603 RepID=A0A2S4HE64_9GAMM|nr:hypothetical protein [Marortus luteolus]POP52257.1 hypothetical protein C0068_12830 [Marortus luteolus]
MHKLKIKPELLSLLSSTEFSTFSSDELSEAYLKLDINPALSKKRVQQFINRNIERLMSAGLVIEEQTRSGTAKHYHITNKFHPANYSVGSPHGNRLPNDLVNTKSNTSCFSNLKKQLQIHKLDLLTTISETEEYEVLSNKLPNQREELQELYNDARIRYSKTLGRIKAIELLLSKCLA